jgi:hypothetical protein
VVTKINLFLSALVPTLIKKYVVTFVLSALGLAGGVWTFIISGFLMLLWGAAEKELSEEATEIDQKQTDSENQTKYEADKKAGADSATLIKDETRLLNGDDN